MIRWQDAHALSLIELANLSAVDLMGIQQETERALCEAKEGKARIDGAIAMKYEQRAQSLRQQLGKDTGTVRFDDNGIRVTAGLPKKPIWDQTQLAEIADRIRAAGDHPSEFVEITYNVPERKYTAWPAHLRKTFAPARTLKTGKATFRLSVGGEAAS